MAQQMGIGMDDQKLAEKALDLVRKHRILAELVVLISQPEYAKKHEAEILHEQLVIDLALGLRDGQVRCTKAVLEINLAPGQPALVERTIKAGPVPRKAQKSA